MKSKIIRAIILVVCIGMMAYSAWNLYSINYEYEEMDEVYEDIVEKFVVIEEANDTDVGNNKTNTGTTAPVQEVKVSFEELIGLYPDVKAWLYCEGTPINYPVVKAKDNDYYLRRMVNGKYNVGGTLFIDYRCSSDFSDWNTIIYGHNMKNGTMFGVLPKYMKQSFFDSHKVMKLTTPDKKYEIELLGGFKTESNDEIYALPANKASRDKLLGRIGATGKVTDEDKLVSLSTCVYDSEEARYVLVGRIVEVK